MSVEQTIVEIFEAQASRTPQAIAIVYEVSVFTIWLPRVFRIVGS